MPVGPRQNPSSAIERDRAGERGGIIETIAGSPPFQLPAQATRIGIGGGGGAVVDAAGNMFIATGELGVILKVDPASSVSVYAGRPLLIADSENHAIRQIDLGTKIITTIAGNGIAGFAGDGSQRAAAWHRRAAPLCWSASTP